MADYQPSFLGSVMKAVACTPNKNFDAASYERDVVEPVRQIRQLQETLGDARPSDAQIRQVIAWLLAIFESKQVDLTEREERLAEIIRLHRLEALFPDLLPLRR